MHKLTGKQCQKARSLLRWNPHDLVTNARDLASQRIDSFERGVLQLQGWENARLVEVFKAAGIVFMENLEVKLEDTKVGGKHSASEGIRIILGGSEGSAMEDRPAPDPKQPAPNPNAPAVPTEEELEEEARKKRDALS